MYEKYYGKGNREALPAMASVGKAYTSIACGIMLSEKHDQIPEGLEPKVFTEKYLPEAFPLDDPRKADITLGQLLTMAAGMHGEGSNPGFVNFEPSVKLEPVPRPAQPLGQDLSALRAPLWAEPGGGYSYASQSPHVASIVLRHLVGMEMQQYIDEKLAKPMGWGQWGYALHRGENTLPHTPGGGDIAIRSTDVAAVRLPAAAQGQMGQPATRPRGIRRARRQTVALPEARALQPDVRGERGRPRGRRAARRILQIGRRRVSAIVRRSRRSTW